MKPSNILFVFPHPFHPERGGVERVTDVLAKELGRRGHRIFYLHKTGSIADYGEYTPPAQTAFLPVRKLKAKENMEFYHRFLREHHIDFIINQMGISRNYSPFTQAPKGEPGFPATISVIHTAPLLNYRHLFSSLRYPKKKKALPILRNILHFLTFPLYRKNFLHKRRKELNAVAQSSDCLCLLSEGYREDLALIGLEPEAPCLVRAIANPCALTADEQPTPKKKQLLFVGRLEPALKAPMRLMAIWEQICHQHPDWELIFVGDGPERKALEKKAATLSRVRLEGFQPPRPYYREASICCLTSTFEGFPMVVLEAMAFGCIPFAYRTFPAINDIFGDEAGQLTVNPFNARQYAEQLSQLMQNEEKRQRYSDLCREKAKQYSIGPITDQWEALMNELAAAQR